MGRAGQPEEIAQLRILASDDASMSGQILHPNGVQWSTVKVLLVKREQAVGNLRYSHLRQSTYLT